MVSFVFRLIDSHKVCWDDQKNMIQVRVTSITSDDMTNTIFSPENMKQIHHLKYCKLRLQKNIKINIK
jgi:hypothetical protein